MKCLVFSISYAPGIHGRIQETFCSATLITYFRLNYFTYCLSLSRWFCIIRTGIKEQIKHVQPRPLNRNKTTEGERMTTHGINGTCIFWVRNVRCSVNDLGRACLLIFWQEANALEKNLSLQRNSIRCVALCYSFHGVSFFGYSKHAATTCSCFTAICT